MKKQPRPVRRPRLFSLVLTGAATLEVQPKLELDEPSAGIVGARHREIAIRATGLAEGGRRGREATGGVGPGPANLEYRLVECVDELDAKLEVCTFSNRGPRSEEHTSELQSLR